MERFVPKKKWESPIGPNDHNIAARNTGNDIDGNFKYEIGKS
jgi:hypothetical protein